MAEFLHYYVLFQNHTDAMALYRALKGESIYAQISPTPRELSVCCGVSLLIKGEDVERIKEIENSGGDTLVSEGIDANYMDIINYAVFGAIKLSEA